MARWTTWKRYTRGAIAKLPNRRGEYEIATRNKITIANGSSDSELTGIRGRLTDRLIHDQHPTGYFFRCRYADWSTSGLDLEARTVARHKAKRGGANLKDNIRSPHNTNPWLL